MNICLNQIKISDMVVFSSMDGLVGIGVFKEVTHAKDLGMPVYYIDKDELRYDFDITANWKSNGNDRTFGRVDLWILIDKEEVNYANNCIFHKGRNS